MAPNENTPNGDDSTDVPRTGHEPTTPYAAEPALDAPAPGAGPAPRKRAARRPVRKATSAPAETGAESSELMASPVAAEADQTAAAEPAPAEKATRKRAPRKQATRARKTAAVQEAPVEEPGKTDLGGPEPGTIEGGPEEPPSDSLAVALEELVSEVAMSAADIDAAAVDESEAEPEVEVVEAAPAAVVPSFSVLFQAPDQSAALTTPTRRRRSRAAVEEEQASEAPEPVLEEARPTAREDVEEADREEEEGAPRRSRRRRGGKGRRGRGDVDEAEDEAAEQEPREGAEAEVATDEGVAAPDEEAGDQDHTDEDHADEDHADEDHADEDHADEEGGTSRRRRRRRRAGTSTADLGEEAPNVSTRVRQPRAGSDEPVAVKGSTRLEAKKQRRREGREAGRRRTVITEAEFLARREAVDRVMVVRNKDGRTQMGVLEDGVLVEHYIDQATNVSMAGNIYLGRVQNVLPSMEAAFVDIGKGRNAVLYAGEVNWDAAGLDAGQPKRIENALTSGQTVLVQVTKDPIGHKGARLTSQISLPGRYLVYVPNSSMTGISRKLPDTERARLKKILRDVVPDTAGVIVRTAAEGASEEELRADVERLTKTWEDIQALAESGSTPRAGKSKGRKKNGASGSSTTGTAPLLLHGEPDLTVRVIRDVFNEDFKQLIVSGEQAWNEIHPYITAVAPDLAERVTKWTSEEDLFAHHRVDEQLAKAMDRKVWLPSGGSLVIDRTEAMTVVDVNTGKFVGSGGNLEETVTKNNLEAAEEIVRQLRLRDIGGIIVIDFIDMVLESNRDLVVRRLLECLGRDRTKHQVAEVTSLGLVQMTRKRVGSGLIEVFSETCDCCNGRGFIIHAEPVDRGSSGNDEADNGGQRARRGRRASSAVGAGGHVGNGPNGADAQEAQRPSGPTAAQIAAAAHAAALKRAESAPADASTEPDVLAPDLLAQDEPAEVVSEVDLESQTSTTEASAEPLEAEGPAVEAPAVEASAVHVPVAETPVVETPVAETPVAGATVEESAVETSPAESAVAEAPARRGRRRHGRVVAPAGPPRTTSTDGEASPGVGQS